VNGGLERIDLLQSAIHHLVPSLPSVVAPCR
jgi:hypothetical protein